ncbi:DUF3995 domain-containing protein [Paenibacillus beijingensis]|uniref:Membrane protein n=1 Tax=Paenibacillus beijingensis TaxID=1126833 RepID=A0A0D5NKP7_9BACL|nr:DUF3995 domain-containing protein [Paenibacillus beijingensis]AJY75924.1 membrane protein [Paenibacillus beijingensis]
MAGFMMFSSAIILGLISLLHYYWAFGGRWGVHVVMYAREGEHQPAHYPGAAATIIVATLILLAGFLLPIQGGYVPSIEANLWTRSGCIVCAFVFVVRAIGEFKYLGFFKRVRHSAFSKYDTWLYSPLCLYLGITFVLILV